MVGGLADRIENPSQTGMPVDEQIRQRLADSQVTVDVAKVRRRGPSLWYSMMQFALRHIPKHIAGSADAKDDLHVASRYQVFPDTILEQWSVDPAALCKSVAIDDQPRSCKKCHRAPGISVVLLREGVAISTHV